jgi:hypothetical protein
VGKTYAALDASQQAFIEMQHMFFVATAPSGPEGHVNCSPKGLNSFRIVDSANVMYLDYVGSGIETVAHVRQNGRIVIMFCAFEGPPKILRLHGRATVLEPCDAEFTEHLAQFEAPQPQGIRSIIRINLTRISDSCGFGVPQYRYEGQRDQLQRWAERKGNEGLVRYKKEKNAVSIDGLPGLDPARRQGPADG